MNPTYLKNAPIREALIDLQVEVQPDFDVHKLRTELQPGFALKDYQGAKEIRQIQIVNAKGITDSRDELIGFRYDSNDGVTVIQARTNGFTFSHLKPYRKWDDFKDECRDYWDQYKKVIHPKKIHRVAVRYINVIESIQEIDDLTSLGGVFVAPPALAPDLPQQVLHCLSRIIVRHPDNDCIAVVTRALERKDTKEKPFLVLDIDVFKHFPSSISEEDVWKLLDEMRSFKNSVFFKSLTAPTIERFK